MLARLPVAPYHHNMDLYSGGGVRTLNDAGLSCVCLPIAPRHYPMVAAGLEPAIFNLKGCCSTA